MKPQCSLCMILLFALWGIPIKATPIVPHNIITLPDTTRYQHDKSLEEVIVTASRTQKFLKDVPVVTQVITQQQIKKIEPNRFSEILEYSLPGIEFEKHGGQDQLSYRGFDGGSLLFLIDGELITTGSTSTIDFDRINPDNIERIEIIRGAASALYGSNALGGVINIITKSASKPLSVSVLSSLNGRDNDKHINQRYGATLSVNQNKVSNHTTFGYQNEYGFILKDADNGFNRIFDTHRIYLAEKISYTPTRALKLRATANYNRRQQTNDKYLNHLFKAFDATTGAFWNIASGHSLDISYHFNSFRRDSILPLLRADNDPSYRRSVFDEKLHHLRAQYNFDYNNQHTLNVGSEFIHDNIKSPRLEDPSKPSAKQMLTGILYGQYTYEPTKELALSYGGRLDMRSNFGVHYTNRFTVKYRPTYRCILRGSYSEGYRTPSMQELYFFFDHSGMFMIYGNPKLRPEKSRMFMLSSEYSHPKVTFNANAFYNSVRDRIIIVSETQKALRYWNAPKKYNSHVYGIDFNLTAKLAWGFSVNASYTYTYDYYPLLDSEGRPVNNNKGKRLLSTTTRPHAVVGMLAWDKRFNTNYALSINFALRFLSGFKSAEWITNEQWGYRHYDPATLTKLGISQNIWKGFDLYLGIDNLFAYQPKRITFNTPLTPGRSYIGTLRYTW